MAKKDKKQPEKEVKVKGLPARIFAMPEKYRHGSSGQFVKPEDKKQAPVVVKQPVPKPPPVQKPTLPGKRSTTKTIAILGGVVVILLAVGGFFVVQSSNNQDEPTEPVVVVPNEPTEPTSRPEPVDEPPEDDDTTISDPFEGDLTSGKDTDSDGLSDKEEELVYKTDPQLPDSDLDGFLDGNEVFHRYNPNGTAPGTLLAAGVVNEYSVDTGMHALNFSYPSSWVVSKELTKPLTITSTTGEKFTIQFPGKLADQTLRQWYTKLPEAKSGIKTAKTKNGLNTLKTADQLQVYIEPEEGSRSVLSFTYDPGRIDSIDYLQTFLMIINSIEISESSGVSDFEGEISASVEEGTVEGAEEAPGELEDVPAEDLPLDDTVSIENPQSDTDEADSVIEEADSSPEDSYSDEDVVGEGEEEPIPPEDVVSTDDESSESSDESTPSVEPAEDVDA